MTELEAYKILPTSIVRIFNNYNLWECDPTISWVELENQVITDLTQHKYEKYYNVIDNLLSNGKIEGKVLLTSTYIQNVSTLLKKFEKRNKLKTECLNFQSCLDEQSLENVYHRLRLLSNKKDGVVVPYQLIEQYSQKGVSEILTNKLGNKVEIKVVYDTPLSGTNNRTKVTINGKPEWVYFPVLPLVVAKIM